MASASPTSTPTQAGARPDATSSERVDGARESGHVVAVKLEELDGIARQMATAIAEARGAQRALTGALQKLEPALAETVSEPDAAALRSALTELEEHSRVERQFIVDEHDRFLASILGEHEQTVLELQAERDALKSELATVRGEQSSSEAATLPPEADVASGPPDPEALAIEDLRLRLERVNKTVDRLTEEREQAREALKRLQTQRDAAQAALEQIHRERREQGIDPRYASASTVAPVQRGAAGAAKAVAPSRPSRVPTFRPPPSEPLELNDIGGTSGVQAKRPGIDSVPPLELRGAVTSPPRRQTAPPGDVASVLGPSALAQASRPPLLKRKPDPTKRPLVDYSFTSGDVETEHLGGTSSRPPRR
jgi:hypothetical protein